MITHAIMRDESFCGSSTYRRRVELPGLLIETSPNGGMSDPGFWVTVNGVDYGINSVEEMERLIASVVREHGGGDVLYPTYGHGIGRTMEPWKRG